MIVRYEDGSTAHAVIYRLTGSRLRAAVEGADGAGVTFEFPIEIGMEFLQTLTDLALSEEQGHCAMGGDCVIRRMAEPGKDARPN